MSAQDIDAGAALPKTPRDFVPLLLPLVLAAIAYPFIPSSSTWLTLTIAGLTCWAWRWLGSLWWWSTYGRGAARSSMK